MLEACYRLAKMEKLSEIDTLFKTSTIDEIKDAEKNLRGAIEKKKEDLRLMVGERYRDLINAADTINQMKGLSEDIHEGINSIQKCCTEFKKRTPRRRRTTSEGIKLGNEDINFYALATQMELLVDTPEKIWDALDKQKFLIAAQLFLLGHHIVNNSLHINTGYGNQSDVFANFPVLHHQWAAISHFKDSILKGSSASLKDPTLPDKALAESLCSTILLNDSSPRQVFMEFLLARKSAIQDIFNSSQHKTSIKRQVCDVTSLIVLTLQQIFSLFYHPGSQQTTGKMDVKSLLYMTINEVTKKKQSDQGESLQWLFGEDFDVLTVARHLPPTVSGFRPKLRSVISVVPEQTIRNGAKEWLAGCIIDVHEGVAKLLDYIKSVKGLASIRDAVYDLLSDSRLFGAKSQLSVHSECVTQDPDNWNHLCEAVLDRRLSLWDEFFEDNFVNRAKSILETMYADVYTGITQSLDATLTKLAEATNDIESDISWDRNVTSYLWNELPGDLPTSGWCMEPTQGEPRDVSSLTLKAKGCTPSVQTLCKHFNTRLGEIVDDGKYLFESVKQYDISKAPKIEAREFPFEENTRIEPFQKFACAAEAQAFLQECTTQLIEKICIHIGKSLNELKSQLMNTKETDHSHQSLCLDRIAFLGRLCAGVPEYGTNLTCLACGLMEEAKSTLPLKGNRTRQRKGKQTKTGVGTNLEKIQCSFAERQKTAFGMWKDWVVQKTDALFRKTITSVEELMVYGTTCWEDITIEEEADTGNKVQSKIRVPAQASSFLMSLLFRVCEETNRIGGHTVDRSLVKELTFAVGDVILTCLEEFANNNYSMSQNRALQTIFDVKFLVLFIGGNSETKEETSKKYKKRGNSLVNKLESFVDPFDLDVFTPHMTNFIHRQLQRSWLLLGTISNIDKHTLPPLTNRTSSMSQEQHNVVPFAPNPVRFMLLPISTHQEKTSQLKIKDLELEKTSAYEANNKLSMNCPLFEHLYQFTLDIE